MKKTLGLLTLALACSLPAGAQTAAGMAAMQYYVGSWTCQAAQTGMPPANATVTYTMDTGVMHQMVVVPPQGKMTSPYALSVMTVYDDKNGRYVSTSIDTSAAWSISYAKPWTGNSEQWTDQSTSDGKLHNGQTVRTDQNSFVYTSYPVQTPTVADFKATCTRSS